MFAVHDPDTQSMIGGFETYDEASEFLAKVDDLSKANVNNLEIYELNEPNEWLFENMENILMASF